jgi:hypothetical protein
VTKAIRVIKVILAILGYLVLTVHLARLVQQVNAGLRVTLVHRVILA